MWIQRDISNAFERNHDTIQVVRGPRQCGKSSLILHLDSSFHEISLDDPALRELAQENPELLLKQFEGKKLFIDEAQYAPNLFPSLKRLVDLHKRSDKKKETRIRISGSNQILMDRNVKESLAGRVSYFDLNTLSVAEILRSFSLPIQEILYRGGWPELFADSSKDPRKYLDDYVNSYVEKDIVLAAGIQKASEFLKFVRLLAGRVGQILDLTSLSNEIGIDAKTIKDWTGILERMHLIALVPPFFSNLSSRLIKRPKVYFLDTGLACRLQGWSSSTPILTSPQQGSLFENLVFAEIFKLNQNYQLGWLFYHWRTRDGEEVDFLVQKSPNEFFILEAKVNSLKPPELAKFPEIKKVFPKIPPAYLCVQEGSQILGNRIPAANLSEYLLAEAVAK